MLTQSAMNGNQRPTKLVNLAWVSGKKARENIALGKVSQVTSKLGSLNVLALDNQEFLLPFEGGVD